jgi:hypothetical protein
LISEKISASLLQGRLSKSNEGRSVRSAISGLIIGFMIMSLIPESCTPNETSTMLSIVMTTDKMQYVGGEVVKLKVTNNLDIPILYIGYSQRDLHFWEIEKAQDNDWQGLNFHLPLIEGGIEVCRLTLLERPIGDVTELKPHADLLYEWNQKICLFKAVTEPTEPKMIERGRCRFVLRYSLDTVKSENVETEPWKRPIDLGEIKVVYSNEFVLE